MTDYTDLLILLAMGFVGFFFHVLGMVSGLVAFVMSARTIRLVGLFLNAAILFFAAIAFALPLMSGAGIL